MAGLSPDEIEDGTGLATALVYDDAATAAAYLTRRGLAAFAGLDETARAAALIRATEAAESAVRPLLRSVAYGPALLFPAVGAYDSSGRLLEPGERPTGYRQGIFLLAEAAAKGTLLGLASQSGIAAESSKQGSITYRGGANLASISVNHPEAWSKISTVINDRW